MGDASRCPHPRIDIAEQHGFGVHDQVERKHSCQADHERLNCPPAIFRRTPVELLSHGEAYYRDGKQDEEDSRRARRRHAGTPWRIFGQKDCRDQQCGDANKTPRSRFQFACRH